MSGVKEKKTRDHKGHRRRGRSSKAAEQKATTAASMADASGPPPIEPVSKTSQADATKAEAQEAETGATGAAPTAVAVGSGTTSTPQSEINKQSSSETGSQTIEPTSSGSSSVAGSDRASGSCNVTDGSVTGDLQNLEECGGEDPRPVDFRPREGSFLHGMVMAGAIQEMVLLPAVEWDQVDAATGQEEAPQWTPNAAPCDSQTTATVDGTDATPEVLVSTGAMIADAEADQLRGDSSTQIPSARIATSEEAVAQEGSREGGTAIEGPGSTIREGSAAAGATTVLGVAAQGKATAQPSVKSTKTAVSQRVSASRPRTAKARKLDESFYQRIAVIRRSPQIPILSSISFGGRLVLYLVAICGTVVAIAVVIATFIPRPKQDTSVKTCETLDCLVHASLLKNSLNASVDPCQDFSAYVCSRWAPMQGGFRRKIHSVMDGLLYAWFNEFGNTLRLGSRKLPAGNKALAMYEMCMSASSSGEEPNMRIPVILSLLRYLPAGWRDISDETVSAVGLAVLFAYRWQAPFWLTVNVLGGSPSTIRRVVVKPGAYLPMFLRQHRIVATFYGQYMKAFFGAYSPHSGDRANNRLSDDHIKSVQDMEADVLVQLMYVYSGGNKPALLTFGELDEMVAHGSSASGGLFGDFRQALSLKPPLTPQDKVLASHAALFEVLAGLVAKYGDEKLKYLLIWEFVQVYLPLGDLGLLVTHYGSKSKADVNRRVYCAFHVEASFKVLVLSLAVAAGFAAELRDRIDARFDGLVSAAVKKVKNATWLDEESKTRVVNKLTLVKKRMWPPRSLLADKTLAKIYANISDNETSVAEFWIRTHLNLGEANESADYMEALRLPANNLTPYIDYDYIFNSVQVATSLAAAPAYYRNGTEAMFYGGLGLLMAMQLVKFIDKTGLKWAAPEIAVDSILSNSSRAAYDDRFRCLNEFGIESAFPEIPALEIVHSALTESSGLGGELHLPLSPELTEGKVFFLTICYMSCATTLRSELGVADCNKLVRNSEYFAEAFSCAKGSRMNPRRKCSFFS
ncbi:hypothetical protein HPB50_009830 [Hyalomma asiaticum]|uniref:Uncharacterized protein n=1 Tax=Hyalomma asiaticum TaxID=266040 RepID=A0ACB7RS66_HYAAI|nr:hypothetical protein HPB50_009830 [Hyalomma asiaticum]